MSEQTYWNGEPCQARRVAVIVADSGRFRLYWAKDLVGQERDAVEITVGDPGTRVGANPEPEQTFYLDDEEGKGWAKVTIGRGSPQVGHRTLDIERVVRERD